ncbi:conserved hypothetical protein [Capnocytophaga canimorsus]|nr:conserved hypothetical protein [Capnocytophaga canimorsus]
MSISFFHNFRHHHISRSKGMFQFGKDLGMPHNVFLILKKWKNTIFVRLGIKSEKLNYQIY